MKNISNHKLPFIAIVGKPNVGKSSLFNRLIGRRIAITSDEAGTTRDRVFQRTIIGEYPVIMVDTGGLEYGKKINLEAEMQLQAKLAIDEADLIIFLVDGREEPTADDVATAQILRKQSKKLLLVANKIDSEKSSHSLFSWAELGFGEAVSISVIHNLGLEKLEKIIVQQLDSGNWTKSEEDLDQTTDKSIKIALIGRPNAGKSSLVNALLGEKRVIVSDIPGTTRDAVDIDLKHQNQSFTLIDTAGLRKRGKIEPGIEKYSTFRTINAIERSDLVCLVLDYSQGIRAQDLHISSYILDAKKGLIILINKYDLMEEKEEEKNRIGRILKNRFDYLSWAPVLFVSAKNHKNIELIYDTAQQIFEERKKQIDHEDLVDFTREVYHRHAPPTYGRKKLAFYDLIQIPSSTPTFEFIVNDTDIVHFSYRRYLENAFREQFGFLGTSLIFNFREVDKKTSRNTQPL